MKFRGLGEEPRDRSDRFNLPLYVFGSGLTSCNFIQPNPLRGRTGMRHQSNFRMSDGSRKPWVTPEVRSIQLTAEEYNKVRSADDPKQALKTVYIARKKSGIV